MLSDSRGEPVKMDVFKEVATAAKDVPAVFSVVKGGSKRINIKDNVSPKILYNGRVEYFEVVEIDGTKDSEFSFFVYAICDCIGLRKWAVLSESLLVDPDGKLVEIKETGDLQTRNLVGKFPKSGIYKLLILANSKYSGMTMGEVVGQFNYSDPNTRFSLPLTIHPTGMVKVKWKE
jgi:hypothetical protein